MPKKGDPSELAARFAATSSGIDTVVTSPAGFAGAPVFEPGETVTQLIEITDANINRYFSYASMIIPSNDAFVANFDPRQLQLFDTNGNFQGARSFTISADQVWDAGTEVNDPAGGAAFSTEGGTSVDENGVVHQHAGLSDFVGSGLPTGQTLSVNAEGATPLARITITLFDPEASACSGVVGACSVSSVPLQNSQLAYDVNNDGVVSPLDALLIINFLESVGPTTTIDDEARALDLFLDVGGDGNIAPIDVLLVVNRLERQNQVAGLAEGESDLSNDAAFEELFSRDESGLDDNLLEALSLGR